MRQFLIKVFILSLSAFVMFVARESLVDDVPTWTFANDVYQAIELSQKPTTQEKVVLGDSVARQLFNPDHQVNDNYYHLTSNQAISMLGQYILLENYLKENAANTDEVILLMIPESFDNNLDQTWTFNYVLLPFFSNENEPYISDYALSRIRQYPFYFVSRFKPFRYVAKYIRIDYSQFKDGLDYNHEYYLSPISIEYLKRMSELCKKHDITFTILSAPLSDERTDDDYTFMKEQINDNGLNKLFAEYFPNLTYYPREVFVEDGIHFKWSYAEENLLNIIGNLKRDGSFSHETLSIGFE